MPAQARRKMPTNKQLGVAAVLLSAVYVKRADTVAALLERDGADPNILVEDGMYPLSLAIGGGSLDIVRLLIRHGADVELCEPKGCSAIYIACEKGHLAIVKELIKAGADLNRVRPDNPLPLHWMADRGNIEILKELIRAGAQMNLKEVDGFMPIHYAAGAGSVPALRELVLAGSSHDWRNDARKSPLSIACYHGHVAAVVYLLDEAKANPGVTDDTRYTPLASACQQGHFAVVKVLLRCGVRKLGPNAYLDGLCMAAMVGNFAIMRELIGAEGGVHLRDANTSFAPQVTPLHYAAGYCHPFAMSLLLEAGADETVKDSSGDTPFDVVNTQRDENIKHGFGRLQARRILRQAPAYRARSWKWPDTSAVFADSATAVGPAKSVAEETSGEARARSAKAEPEPTEMTVEDFDRAFDAAMSFAAAPAVAGKKVDLVIYRRPAISSGGSAADGRPAVVASLIRYAQKR